MTSRNKPRCQYGNKCYRTSSQHFENYRHGSSEEESSDFELDDKCMHHFFKEIIKKRAESSNDSDSSLKTDKDMSDGEPHDEHCSFRLPFKGFSKKQMGKNKQESSDESDSSPNICRYGESCFSKNLNHFKEFRHPHLQRILSNGGNGHFDIPRRLRENDNIVEQLEMCRIINEKVTTGVTRWTRDRVKKMQTSGSETSSEEDLTRDRNAQTGVGAGHRRNAANNGKSTAECQFGIKCYSTTADHFASASHSHLDKILSTYRGRGSFNIPPHLTRNVVHSTIEKQLCILWEIQTMGSASGTTREHTPRPSKLNRGGSVYAKEAKQRTVKRQMPSCEYGLTCRRTNAEHFLRKSHPVGMRPNAVCPDGNSCTEVKADHFIALSHPHLQKILLDSPDPHFISIPVHVKNKRVVEKQLQVMVSGNMYPLSTLKNKVPENRRKTVCLRQVSPNETIADGILFATQKSNMDVKHRLAAPYYMFFTAVTADPQTYATMPLSITFQDLLDESLGTLKKSLLINNFVDICWLEAHYKKAGYKNSPITILYGDGSKSLKTINKDKPYIEAEMITMKNEVGAHNAKISIFVYDDDSVRIVVSTANLYQYDWENRTQGLWISPRCPKLTHQSNKRDGESKTEFKSSLTTYLKSYGKPCVSAFVTHIEQADLSAINVHLVTSIPGIDTRGDLGLERMAKLLGTHSYVPKEEHDKWNIVVQTSSLSSYGDDRKRWLTADFPDKMCRSYSLPLQQSSSANLDIIYPSYSTVKGSQDGLKGGDSLEYFNTTHLRQPWINQYLRDWSCMRPSRHKAMPHMNSYLRLSPDAKKATFFLLTSAPLSKSSWGILENETLRMDSYEAGVLFLPKFITKQKSFSVKVDDSNRLPIPYDLTFCPYSKEKTPWVWEFSH